jgi:nucleoid-associated protein YgaU
MSERPIADVGPLACPFVAFEHDQARRSIEPDRRHRCYAEPAPAPRAISHQTTYCLSSGFSACPTFRAWAKRTAARQSDDRQELAPRPIREVSVAPMPQRPDPASMGLVTDDSRPAVSAAGAGRAADAQMPSSAPEWAAPPTWSASMMSGTDDELAALVRPPAGDGPEADLDAGDVPAFLADRPSTTSATSATRASSSAPDGADRAEAGGTSARPRSSVGQARPASRGLRRPARIDAAAPAWETPRRFEAYPTLRTRVGMPRVPTIALGAVAVLAAALLLFLLPSIVAGPSATPTPTPQPSVASEAPVTPEPVATPVTYTIVAGDTISKIAKKFNVTPEDLLAANPQVKNPNKIKVGDQLTIPVPVTAEPSQEAVPSDEVSPSP